MFTKFVGLIALLFCCFTPQNSQAKDFDYFDPPSARSVAPKARADYFVLITGCARSGTVYIASLLSACGLDVKHEKIGKGGIASWPMAVESSYSPWGPPDNGIDFVHIFHQVRHPLKTISSVYTTEKSRSWNFIIDQMPQIKHDDTPTVKCAKYWYYWNLKAEAKAEWTYRLEDIDKIFDEMGHRLGVKLDREALKKVRRDANSRGPHAREFTWQDLQNEIPPALYNNIRSLAQRYGYSLD